MQLMKYLPLKTSLVVHAVSTITFIAAPSLSAALLAYEGFDYTEANGTSISGLNGGTGWTEAFPTVEGTIRLANGLSFTDHIASSGKSAERLASATLTGNGRNWASTVSDGTYWYSFLMHPTATATNVGRGTFGILQGPGTNQNGFGIRFDFTGTAGPGATLTINANSPAQAPGANITFASGWDQAYLVLGRLNVDTAANTINDIWVYQNGESIPTSEVGLPTVMSTTSGASTGINPAMYGRAFGDSAPTFFDEVRVGTSFADVMVIPEPSAAALGLIGLTALLRRRRH
jgi:hypothetical protein